MYCTWWAAPTTINCFRCTLHVHDGLTWDEVWGYRGWLRWRVRFDIRGRVSTPPVDAWRGAARASHYRRGRARGNVGRGRVAGGMSQRSAVTVTGHRTGIAPRARSSASILGGVSNSKTGGGKARDHRFGGGGAATATATMTITWPDPAPAPTVTPTPSRRVPPLGGSDGMERLVVRVVQERRRLVVQG